MFRPMMRIAFVLLNSLILVTGLLFVLNVQVAISSSKSSTTQVLYVAPNSQCGEFSGTPPTSVTPCFAHPQLAVDAANSGDMIKIAAGVYQGVYVRNSLTQLLYVDKTVTIQGGYSTSDWTNTEPDTRWVTLDAQKQGRVLYISGEISPTIDGLRLTNGIAGGTWVDTSGGGIFISNADPTITHNVIFSNTAAQWGGGIYMESSDAILQYNNILSNTATGNSWGGGLKAMGGLPTISNNLVRGNSAHVGGGMQVTGGWVISNTITANTARDYGEYGGGGGGVVVTLGSDALTLENNFISGNASSRDGGGMWITDRTNNTTIRNNRIMTNTAVYWGGGVFMENGQQLNLDNNLIQGNSAGVGGAGMFSQNSTVNVRGNTIANNSGGGIYEWYGEDAFYANQITGNVSGNGGGVTLYKSDCAFVNNVIAHNIASQKGSGVFIQGASSRFWNTTFSSNSGGDGIALFVVDYPGPLAPGSTDEVYSHVELTNTIMVNQTTAISISFSVNNTVVSSGALWNGNGANWEASGQ
jgi:hypothetical protein